MWWVEWSGLEFFSILGLPTICVLDRQDMLSSDLGLGNVFRRIRLFLGLFYWVHQSLQKRLMFVGGDFLYSLERESVKRLLLGSAHLLQERLEGNESRHRRRGRRAPSSGSWPPPWSASHRGSPAARTARTPGWCRRHFCRTASGSQRSRGSHPGPWSPCRPCTWGRHRLGEELLAPGDSTADLLDGLQGGVQVAGADEVANVEGVDLAVSLEVIDVKGEVDGINLLLLQTKLSHFDCWDLTCSSLTRCPC